MPISMALAGPVGDLVGIGPTFLVAGLVPGLLATSFYVLAIAALARLRPALAPPGGEVGAAERRRPASPGWGWPVTSAIRGRTRQPPMTRPRCPLTRPPTRPATPPPASITS